jgi:DNA-binding NarL/FixJ family response regulator
MKERLDSLQGGLNIESKENEGTVVTCLELSKGLTNREIARKLFLTEGTVKNYISAIYSKLDVTGRHKAVFKAKGQGIIKP